ncbi:MAG: hypothetical protein LBG30_01350 [Odoribacteraceae bacterium]|nr:hypothetical protein [Odoribacteraceae bacterium]
MRKPRDIFSLSLDRVPGNAPATTGFALSPAGNVPATTGFALSPAGNAPATTGFSLSPAGNVPATTADKQSIVYFNHHISNH